MVRFSNIHLVNEIHKDKKQISIYLRKTIPIRLVQSTSFKMFPVTEQFINEIFNSD